MCDSEQQRRLSNIELAARNMMHGDEKAASAWLITPLAIFAYRTPIEHAATELGIHDVEELIGRIRYGVFS
jgi:putative toxin-antitoxin system antitoxin component (TIGR02293 family)